MTEAKKSNPAEVSIVLVGPSHNGVHGEVSIVLVGPSHNGVHGETRTTDAETAANLVAVGAARYAE